MLRREMVPRKTPLKSLLGLCAFAVFAAGCGGGGSGGNGGGGGGPAPTGSDVIYFSSGRTDGENRKFFAMSEDGSSPRQVPSLSTWNAGLSEGISKNSNGTVVCFFLNSNTSAFTQAIVVRLSDGAKLFDTTYEDLSVQQVVTANSSGSTIAYAGPLQTGDQNAIYTLKPDGSGKTKLWTAPVGAIFGQIRYLPDDSKLYFLMKQPGNTKQSLYTLKPGDPAPALIPTPDAPLQSVAASSDGKLFGLVAFTSGGFKPGDVSTIVPYEMNRDGSGLETGTSITTDDGGYLDLSAVSFSDGM
ncbi:MAG TPA: hypothetical protein VG944_23490 [Fimbriimonas sp.]|nr:hypothetical protein [Fimbriimonas sp.]